ncbi:ORF2 [Tomato infectious chlorosis virus]|uniref:ORF2 n=1 Tax=Tomato infectious chlorosis virus TaxID=52135 RepID=C7B979_9CLOS|nr:ORF2 [Tomato infectious chlorosis virus]ACS73873.1 ORF2 [Tomato infectious chlorosis virus]
MTTVPYSFTIENLDVMKHHLNNLECVGSINLLQIGSNMYNLMLMKHYYSCEMKDPTVVANDFITFMKDYEFIGKMVISLKLENLCPHSPWMSGRIASIKEELFDNNNLLNGTLDIPKTLAQGFLKLVGTYAIMLDFDVNMVSTRISEDTGFAYVDHGKLPKKPSMVFNELKLTNNLNVVVDTSRWSDTGEVVVSGHGINVVGVNKSRKQLAVNKAKQKYVDEYERVKKSNNSTKE